MIRTAAYNLKVCEKCCYYQRASANPCSKSESYYNCNGKIPLLKGAKDESDKLEKCSTCNGTGTTKGKPPLGIIPHKLWIEGRIRNLEEAIVRYITSGNIMEARDWVSEVIELRNEHENQ